MITKTPSEIIDFALDSKAISLTAQVGDGYVNYVKLPVGTATYVYSVYQTDPSCIEKLDNSYTLAAIVADNIVYVTNNLNLFGTILDSLDNLPNVKCFKDYVAAANKMAYDIYCDWYAALPLSQAMVELSQLAMELVRREYILYGKDSQGYAEPPKAHDFVAPETAAKFLTESLVLETFVLHQLEAEREDYMFAKSYRARMLELVRRGADIPEETKVIADAIRDAKAQTLTLILEHDGLVRECKYYKKGLQNSLMKGCLSSGFLTFKTSKAGDEVTTAFRGKRREDIPLSYISRITSKGKVVYARKDAT